MRPLFKNRSKKLEIGNYLMVHAYKLNGWLYRTWEFPILLDITNEYHLIALFDTRVISSEENSLRCFSSKIKVPTFWYFFNNEWFNMMVTIHDPNNVTAYINISSPHIYEEGAIKYYDFDLDFRVIQDGSWFEMDIKEYQENSQKYNYPEELKIVISSVEKKIIEMLNSNQLLRYLSDDNIEYLTQKYLEHINKKGGNHEE